MTAFEEKIGVRWLALRAELASIRGILLEDAERLTNADRKPEADQQFWVGDLSHTVLVLPHMLPKRLGLEIPPGLLTAADDVIE